MVKTVGDRSEKDWKPALAKLKEGQWMGFDYNCESYPDIHLYCITPTKESPDGGAVAVHEPEDGGDDSRNWSCYYPSFKAFDDHCHIGNGASITDPERRAKREQLYKGDLEDQAKAGPYWPFDVGDDGSMYFLDKKGRVWVLPEECAVKFRKYLDKMRAGDAKIQEEFENVDMKYPYTAIYKLTGMLPVAIYKNFDMYFKHHSSADEPEVEGRLPRWMRKEDFIHPYDWELAKVMYGVEPP